MPAVRPFIYRVQRIALYLFSVYAVLMCAILLTLNLPSTYFGLRDLTNAYPHLFDDVAALVLSFLTIAVVYKHLFKRSAGMLDSLLLAVTSCLVFLFWYDAFTLADWVYRVAGFSEIQTEDTETYMAEFSEHFERALSAIRARDHGRSFELFFMEDAAHHFDILVNSWFLLLLLSVAALHLWLFLKSVANRLLINRHTHA